MIKNFCSWIIAYSYLFRKPLVPVHFRLVRTLVYVHKPRKWLHDQKKNLKKNKKSKKAGQISSTIDPKKGGGVFSNIPIHSCSKVESKNRSQVERGVPKALVKACISGTAASKL